ncbi:hypothetical protein BH23GEM6_BH23GEM6_16720 [soil metagenome]
MISPAACSDRKPLYPEGMASRSQSISSFDTFLVDDGNRVAASAAKRVAESPGSSFNPLLLFGPPGVGKTHILAAVANRARAVYPEIRLLHEPMEVLLDLAIDSISAGRPRKFRAIFDGLDLLILDDLHRAAGKDRVQSELSAIVQDLVQRGGQVVVASARAPQDIEAFDSRLAAQLASGLVVDVAPPAETTRLKIAETFLKATGSEVSHEMLKALAAMNIRSAHELRGAVHRIVAETELGSKELRPADLPTLLNLDGARVLDDGDEFDAFLSDISTAVAAAVETSPWRKRLSRAILSWEGEGLNTRRLEAALQRSETPDVESLLDEFERDVMRLRQIGRSLNGPIDDPDLLRDPDRLAEAEALIRTANAPPADVALARPGRPTGRVDEWYRDAEKIAWSWLALEDRIVEEKG